MKNILFIEQRSQELFQLIEKLENEGHYVEAFESTQDALDGIHIHSPDLIILDSNTLSKKDILRLVGIVGRHPNLQNATVCLVTQTPEEYQELKVSVLRAHPNAQEVRAILSKPQLPTPSLDNNIFDEIAQEVLKKPNPKKETQELEHRIEILKRDSQILLQSKDKRILDLKRKIDVLELEITELSSRLEQSYQRLNGWNEKMDRVLKALKISAKQIEECQHNLHNFKKNA
ncbi:MAG: hypothetical protein HYS98_00490 [Deltaproteobacteria bacterium]|nr:hypothetical protein [Deltaproteobacteria bacterium]